jgi:hypothetical protein
MSSRHYFMAPGEAVELGGWRMSVLALLGKMIQWGSERNANKV